MHILFILISLLLVYSDLNCKQNQHEFWLKSNFRRLYKDVASQSNGAILSNARSILTVGGTLNISPLKDSLQIHGEDPHFYTRTSIDIQFTQLYEINRIKIWYYDFEYRIFSFKIIAIVQDNIEKELYLGYHQKGLVTIEFEDQFVQKIKIIHLGSTHGDLAILKIQASYVIKNLL